MKRFSLFVTVLLAGGASAHAAEPVSADAAARAQALFDQALTAARSNDFKKACPLFRASQDADPKTSTLLNLGTCYERNFQTASAWAAFRAAEGSAKRAGRADLEEQAHRKVAQIEPSIVRLTIDVPAASRVPGLVVKRDGAVVPPTEWQLPLPVDPGEHVVSAEAPQHQAWDTHTLVGNESRKVVVPTLVKNAGFWTVGRKVGVGVAAVGVAAFVSGIVVGFVGKGQYDDAKSTCTGTTNCAPGSAAKAEDARSLETVASVLTISGAVVAAGGGALVLFAGPRKKKAEPQAAALVLHAAPSWVGLSGHF